MGNRRIGEGQMSRKARQRLHHRGAVPKRKRGTMVPFRRRGTTDAAASQRAMLRKLGADMVRSGAKFGRRARPLSQTPNLANYKEMIRGAGRRVNIVPTGTATRRT